jgi:hypothetical protein
MGGMLVSVTTNKIYLLVLPVTWVEYRWVLHQNGKIQWRQLAQTSQIISGDRYLVVLPHGGLLM